LARTLPDLLKTWEVGAGELVLDLTGATAAMAGAMVLVGNPFASRVVMIGHSSGSSSGETIAVNGQERVWIQGNPWDEGAAASRRDACELFNRGAHQAASTVFRQIECRVSGGQKPLYHALADLSDGYHLWERFQYRQAWDKLKTALKAMEMAAVWGGPAGLKGLLPPVKQNAGFLEKLVLDPQEVREAVAHDLLAHARRRADADHHAEAAVAALVRALEACAQYRLFKQYRIKTWDVRPEQLPQALQESCRNCYLDDVDGKYKLPPLAQFRTLAEFGDAMGRAYLAQWVKMKPLLDAAAHGILSHGFEAVKPERFHQLYDLVVKVTGVNDLSLPKFPVLAL
jgi:CRISPR-associated protein (TIGR02710 family)